MATSEATEFSRRRNLPDVEVRYLSAGRTFTVALRRRGSDIGQKLEVSKRGKVVSTTYVLPSMKKD
jgi:hypothetical protein